MTHPGMGRITALATEVFLGEPSRFANSKELASYVGMIPGEYSSGGRECLGALSKQGNCCDFSGEKRGSISCVAIRS
jgi:transposase